MVVASTRAAGGRWRLLFLPVIAVLVLLGAATLAGAENLRPATRDSETAQGPKPASALRLLIDFKVHYLDLLHHHEHLVRIVQVPYTGNGGRRRTAYLILPRWYRPGKDPAIPLVISPHGRGVPPSGNIRLWGGLPAFGPFAVVTPEGQGRRLTLYSWGWRGQIDDLARMPGILERALPWFHIDHARIYAVGSSMGGQETLLLVALHPQLFAGAIALDSATDIAARYRDFRYLGEGRYLQRLARLEIGGTPATYPRGYAQRSPMSYVEQIAFAGVPLSIWWSKRDQIVVNQNQESGRLYRAIERANPTALVTQYVGTWAHSREMDPLGRLPLALVDMRLIQLDELLPATAKP
jgi:poly(3-hydroxybutyrate) depolymerase